MKEYPEGNGLYWAIIEYGFAAFCIGSIAICVLIACGGAK